MPRPRLKRGSPAWSARPHVLSESAEKELAGLLGLDDPSAPDSKRASEALREIERWLGFYPGAVQAHVKVPRSADYRAILPPIEAGATGLVSKLGGLNPWMRDALEVRGANVASLEEALTELRDATSSTIGDIGSGESRGKPKDIAFRVLIGKLRRVFIRYYAGGDFRRRTTGAVKPLSESQGDEVDFVKIALRDAGIPCPRNIRRLFDEPDAALPLERQEVIEKIAGKVRQARQAQPPKTTKRRPKPK